MLAVVLAVYLGFYVWDTFREPCTTPFVYAYTRNGSVETDGLIVRQEQVLPGAQGSLDVTRGEGEKVGKGQTVALVYRDDQARQAQGTGLSALDDRALHEAQHLLHSEFAYILGIEPTALPQFTAADLGAD